MGHLQILQMPILMQKSAVWLLIVYGLFLTVHTLFMEKD